MSEISQPAQPLQQAFVQLAQPTWQAFVQLAQILTSAPRPHDYTEPPTT